MQREFESAENQPKSDKKDTVTKSCSENIIEERSNNTYLRTSTNNAYRIRGQNILCTKDRISKYENAPAKDTKGPR